MLLQILHGSLPEEYRRNSWGRYRLRHRCLAVSHEGPVQSGYAVGCFLVVVALVRACVDVPRRFGFS